MTQITTEHLQHMARRHHATMKKLDAVRVRVSGITSRFVGTVEVGTGSWLGGAIEGRTGGAALGPVPFNLGAGVLLLAIGHMTPVKVEGAVGPGTTYVKRELETHDHLNNLGNGLIGSYLAATGFAWGRKWKDTGKMFGHHSWSQAYGQ